MVLMSGLFWSVVWTVCGNMARGAGVRGHGIGSGTKDSAGETFERLIDLFDNIWFGRGYGHDRNNQ